MCKLLATVLKIHRGLSNFSSKFSVHPKCSCYGNFEKGYWVLLVHPPPTHTHTQKTFGLLSASCNPCRQVKVSHILCGGSAEKIDFDYFVLNW